MSLSPEGWADIHAMDAMASERSTVAELTPNQLAWVEALESGEYKQGTGQLAVQTTEFGENGAVHPSEMRYCCLGVACVLAGMQPEANLRFARTFNFGGEGFYLPEQAQEFLGVSVENPYVGEQMAADLNDQMGLSFSEIAAQVRKYGLSSLFQYNPE